jgi:hypothetical protein
MKRIHLLITFAIPVLLCQNAHGQASSRLVAEAHWSNNGAVFLPVDSTVYVYNSNSRGGDLKNTLKFDNSTSWVYDMAYHNATYWVQTFDANNNITTNIAETWNGSTWVLNTKMIYNYNGSMQLTGVVTQMWDSTAWVGVSEHVYTYNTGGKMQTDVSETWILGAYVPVSEKVYSYDLTNTFIINETDQNLAGGSPVYTNQYVYAYDSTTSQLRSATLSIWNGSGWANSTRQTKAYDTSANLITLLSQNYNAPLVRWDNANLTIYGHFTRRNSNMPQTQLDQVWSSAGSGAWNNMKQSMYSYNAKNQMTSSMTESYNSSASRFEYQSGDPAANYYYQGYSSVLVKNVTNTNGTANIYPVPAQGTLHIDLSWDNAQPATIAIYDMQGRMVTPMIATPTVAEYRAGVSVDNLAAGMYVVSINGTQGQIVKQIVVSH